MSNPKESSTPKTDALWQDEDESTNLRAWRALASELEIALAATTVMLGNIAADLNMTRLLMQDDEARRLAGEIVKDARARVKKSRAVLAVTRSA